MPNDLIFKRRRHMSKAMWDTQTRKAIRRRVKEIMSENPKLKYIGLAEKLNAEGFKGPSGEPIAEHMAGVVARSVGCGKHKRIRAMKRYSQNHSKPQAPVFPKQSQDDTQVLMDLVIDSKLSDKVKISVLRSLRQRS
jgi:hypothetical protein